MDAVLIHEQDKARLDAAERQARRAQALLQAKAVYSGVQEPALKPKPTALPVCVCGKSNRLPYCDGSHRVVSASPSASIPSFAVRRWTRLAEEVATRIPPRGWKRVIVVDAIDSRLVPSTSDVDALVLGVGVPGELLRRNFQQATAVVPLRGDSSITVEKVVEQVDKMLKSSPQASFQTGASANPQTVALIYAADGADVASAASIAAQSMWYGCTVRLLDLRVVAGEALIDALEAVNHVILVIASTTPSSRLAALPQLLTAHGLLQPSFVSCCHVANAPACVLSSKLCTHRPNDAPFQAIHETLAQLLLHRTFVPPNETGRSKAYAIQIVLSVVLGLIAMIALVWQLLRMDSRADGL